MFAGRELIIQVPGSGNGEGRDMLRFPETVCRDPHLLDSVVDRMRLSSEAGHKPETFRAAVKALGVAEHDLGEVTETYRRYDALRRADRNTIWAYVARNLSRPLYLSADERRADVVIGNPPWLALRHMSDDLHKRFKELAQGENIYVGGKLATQNDLSALFFARAVALYLMEGGRIAFVMPLAAMTRGQFEKFRTGSVHTKKVQFEAAWVLGDDVQPLFPVLSCVLFATTHRGLARGLPDKVRRYSGELPYRDAPEALADKSLKVTDGAPRPDEASYAEGSPYRSAFRDGATLYPRKFCLIERVSAGRIGVNPSRGRISATRFARRVDPAVSGFSSVRGRRPGG
jgi:hypothetical protein